MYSGKRLSEYHYYSSRYFRCWKLFVWDTYKEKSLKESTKERRGAGQRRRVTNETKLPSKWKMSLQDTTNKQELFSLLTEKVKDFQFPENKEVNWDQFRRRCFLGSGSSDMQRYDHEIEELLCMFCTPSIKDTIRFLFEQWTQTLLL